MNIVFQNEHLIAVDKPSQWLSVPAREASDPRPCLGLTLQEHLGRQIYPVHRLDFEVSGLVLYALTKVAHTQAQAWFEQQKVNKFYEAITEPSSSPAPKDWEEWSSLLVRGKKRTFAAAHGKPSLTRARVSVEQDSLWLWDLQPITGRPHQLRFELAHRYRPIWGDTLYGDGHKDEPGIRLRAVRLDLSGVEQRFGLPLELVVSSFSLDPS